MANNYSIRLSDGSKTIEIPENVIDGDTMSINLIGHGFPNYGQPQNENFIHMLENFSSDVEPNMAIKGQIWCKKNLESNTYELRICKKEATIPPDPTTGLSDAEWDKILITSPGGEEPADPSDGDIWYDATEHKLKIYDSALKDPNIPTSTGWNVIGPHDAVHNVNEYHPEAATSTGSSTTYIISSSNFMKDIYNDIEGITEPEHTGSLHLVTLKVLIKEVVKNEQTYDVSLLRAAALIYRFVVRTLSTEGNMSISLLGAPNYEILAKSDNLDISTDLYISGGNVNFIINNNSTIAKTYFVNGVDMDITRV